jgi:hypothetical protein
MERGRARMDLEVVHEVLELLAEAGDDGGAGAVGGRPGPAAGELAAGGVGAVERLEPGLHGLGAAEHLVAVGVRAGAEGLHGAGVVRGLALLVCRLQAPVQRLQPAQVLLHDLHVLEEPVEVRALALPAAAAAGLQVVQRHLLLQVRVLLERPRREEVVHLAGLISTHGARTASCRWTGGRQAASGGASMAGACLSTDAFLTTTCDTDTTNNVAGASEDPEAGRRVLFLGNGTAGGRGKGANWRGEKKAGAASHISSDSWKSWHPAEEMDVPRGRIE